jgi:hypothetical protein
MEQIVAAYRETRRPLPLFVDKHFSTEWKKAKQMYEWSRQLKCPLIAGTSLTLTWRRPALELAMEAPVKQAVGYFYAGQGGVRLSRAGSVSVHGGAAQGR